jgi:tetrahydromethanopterin S-methyltransferase subunit D
MRSALLRCVTGREEGHAEPTIGGVIGGVGAILLGIGAAADTGWLAIVGGVVLAVGLMAMLVINHMTVEYNIFGRLDKLEK